MGSEETSGGGSGSRDWSQCDVDIFFTNDQSIVARHFFSFNKNVNTRDHLKGGSLVLVCSQILVLCGVFY